MTINGVTVSDPSTFKWAKYKLFTEDSGRTEDGTNKLSIITQKRKLFCTWRYLTQAQANTLLNLIDPDVSGTAVTNYIPLTIIYSDPITGSTTTKTFQTGDVETEGERMNNSTKVVEGWVNISANFIQI